MLSFLDFTEMPRAVGNPLQIIINKESDLRSFFNSNSGLRPVFTSHNSYPSFTSNPPTTAGVYQIRVSKLFFDFDNKEKPENAQFDLIKLIQWCEAENIPCVSVFSGGKGFHAYILLKPVTWICSSTLDNIIRAIHFWLEKKLEFRTMDRICSDSKRLCRVPYTKYISAKNPLWNGLYCLPLSPDQVKTWNISRIKDYAKDLNIIDVEPHGELLSLNEFLDRFNIELKITEQSTEEINICEYKPIDNEVIKGYLDLYPCLQSQLATRNPKHAARVATTILLKDQGLNKNEVFSIFKRLNPVDFNAGKTAYYINQIYDKQPAYHTYKCPKLQDLGLCVGKACFNFW
jgi:Eukaryotic and archaeal DNA primase, large subunit